MSGLSPPEEVNSSAPTSSGPTEYLPPPGKIQRVSGAMCAARTTDTVPVTAAHNILIYSSPETSTEKSGNETSLTTSTSTEGHVSIASGPEISINVAKNTGKIDDTTMNKVNADSKANAAGEGFVWNMAAAYAAQHVTTTIDVHSTPESVHSSAIQVSSDSGTAGRHGQAVVEIGVTPNNSCVDMHKSFETMTSAAGSCTSVDDLQLLEARAAAANATSAAANATLAVLEAKKMSSKSSKRSQPMHADDRPKNAELIRQWQHQQLSQTAPGQTVPPATIHNMQHALAQHVPPMSPPLPAALPDMGGGMETFMATPQQYNVMTTHTTTAAPSLVPVQHIQPHSVPGKVVGHATYATPIMHQAAVPQPMEIDMQVEQKLDYIYSTPPRQQATPSQGWASPVSSNSAKEHEAEVQRRAAALSMREHAVETERQRLHFEALAAMKRQSEIERKMHLDEEARKRAHEEAQKEIEEQHRIAFEIKSQNERLALEAEQIERDNRRKEKRHDKREEKRAKKAIKKEAKKAHAAKSSATFAPTSSTSVVPTITPMTMKRNILPGGGPGGPPSSSSSSSTSSSSSEDEENAHNGKIYDESGGSDRTDDDNDDNNNNNNNNKNDDHRKPKKSGHKHKSKITGNDRRRAKESDTIKLLPHPTAANFRSWRQSTRQKITAASGRGKAIFPWVAAIEKPGVTFESLEDVGGSDYESIDTKLGDAVTTIIRGEAQRSLSLKSEALVRQGKLISGRQCLWMLYQEYNMEVERGELHDITDLGALKCEGDSKLRAYKSTWDYILQSMDETPSDKNLRVIFFKQIKNVSCLAQEIAEYKKADEGEYKHSYAYLEAVVNKHLTLTRKEENRAEYDKSVRGLLQHAVVARTENNVDDIPGTNADKPVNTALPAKSGQELVVDIDDAKKRDICIKFQTGRCDNGDECRYKHEKAKLIPAPPKGAGKGAKGATRSPPSPRTLEERKSRPCGKFAHGKCTYGDKCHFSHSAPAKPQVITPGAVAKIAISAAAAAIIPGADATTTHIPRSRPKTAGVRFGGIETFIIKVMTMMIALPSYLTGHNRTVGYQHPDGLINSHSASVNAIMSAHNLAHEIGMTFPAAVAAISGPRTYIGDTGSAQHLAGFQDLSKQDKANMIPLDIPVPLMSANGRIDAKEFVPIQCRPINKTIHPLVLENSPSVLSIGRLVIDENMDFGWHHTDKQRPYVHDPATGNTTYFRVENYVPALDADMSPEASSSTTHAMPTAEISGNEEAQIESLFEVPPPPAPHDEHDLPVHVPNTNDQLLRVEAMSTHHMMRHKPKNKYCEVCELTKAYKKQARRKVVPAHTSAEKFGDLVLADHIIIGCDDGAGIDGEKAALFIYDCGTEVRDMPATPTKSAKDATLAMKYFAGDNPVKLFYSDCSPELQLAGRNAEWLHDTSTPYRPEANGKAERGIRDEIEGTRAAIMQSGLPHKWWTYAGRHVAMSENITGEKASPWYRMHKEYFDGKIIPFGALVHHRPQGPAHDKLLKFEPRTVPSIFIGWYLHPGMKFKGEYLVASLADFQSSPADGRVRVHRVLELRTHRGNWVYPLRASADKSRLAGRPDPDEDPTGVVEDIAELHQLQDDHDDDDSITDGGEVAHDTHPNVIDTTSSDAQVEGANYTVIDGRLTRHYSGSSRPGDVWPEVWQLMSAKTKQKEIARYNKSLEDRSTPAATACAAISTTKFEKTNDELTAEQFNKLHIDLRVDVDGASYQQCDANKLVDDADGEHEILELLSQELLATSHGSHRQKSSDHPVYNAMVTKTMHPKDPLVRSPQALAAMSKELASLRQHVVWDESKVCEASIAAVHHPEAHFARLFGLSSIKNYESPNISDHVHKGRIVLGGDKIKTADGQWAIFNDVGSMPSTMAASRVAIAMKSLHPEWELLQSDCERAYIQAEITGPITYVRLPKAWWPAEWASYKDPVAPLRLALYGHPCAGDCWQAHIESYLFKLGFSAITEWPSVYVHGSGDDALFFVLYVDDLIMTGGSGLRPMITKLREHIAMEDPHPIDRYLGCHHSVVTNATDTHVKFDMSDYCRHAVGKYTAITGKTLKPASTPYAPELPDDQLEVSLASPGELQEHAASLLMTLMYAARCAKPEISVAVTRLAAQITRWSAECDRRLHRLFAYVLYSADNVLTGSLGPKDMHEGVVIRCWPDADLNGDTLSSRSTTGYFIELAPKNPSECGIPLSWGSRRQTSSSSSTCEAEVVSLSSALRTEALPMQVLFERLMGKGIDVEVMEDNSAAIIAIKKGYSPALRHLSRTHRISLGLLHEVTTQQSMQDQGSVTIIKAPTSTHKGDMFTKDLPPCKFGDALSMIRIVAKGRS